MDISITTHCYSTSMSECAARLFTLVIYPLALVLYFQRPRGTRTDSTALLTLLLAPAFVWTAAAWLAIARVMEGRSTAGAGRVAEAAGLSFALWRGRAGFIVASIVFCVYAARRHGRRSWRRSDAVSVSLLLLLLSTAVLIATAFAVHHWRVVPFTSSMGGAALATMLLLAAPAVSWRWRVADERAPISHVGVVLVVVGAAAVVLAAESMAISHLDAFVVRASREDAARRAGI